MRDEFIIRKLTRSVVVDFRLISLARVMSSEYFTRTSLYLVRLEIFECIINFLEDIYINFRKMELVEIS